MIPRLTLAVLIIVAFGLALVFPIFPKNYKVENFKGKVKAAARQEKTPKKIENFTNLPEISSRSAIVIDAQTGFVLFEKNPNLRHLPASTTKLMTALVVLENCDPQTEVTVGEIQKEGTKMGLLEGDIVKVEALLQGLLISSANDAAYALASACAPAGGKFIQAMNEKAKDLGMTNTHFQNPAGLDDPNQYSTAADLAKLAKVAVGSPSIAKIVTTKSTVVTDVAGKKTYFLENVNKLLGVVNGVEGIKTGKTEGSLEILISKTTREDHSIIVVVLGSRDRFGESKEMIDWAFKNYYWPAQN